MHKKMINDGVSPGIIIYHVMLGGLCKNMCVDVATSLFHFTSFQRFRPDIKSNILIDEVFRAGKIKEDSELFNAIFTEGLVPDVVTYTLMSKGLIKEGLLDEFDELFPTMEKYGCSSNSNMLNVIVRSLLEKGETKKVLEFLYKMDEQKFFYLSPLLLLFCWMFYLRTGTLYEVDP